MGAHAACAAVDCEPQRHGSRRFPRPLAHAQRWHPPDRTRSQPWSGGTACWLLAHACVSIVWNRGPHVHRVHRHRAQWRWAPQAIADPRRRCGLPAACCIGSHVCARPALSASLPVCSALGMEHPPIATALIPVAGAACRLRAASDHACALAPPFLPLCRSEARWNGGPSITSRHGG